PAPPGILRRMGQPVFQSRAAELAGLGSSVFQAVEPTTLAELEFKALFAPRPPPAQGPPRADPFRAK
ncbi:MAG: hypothetical protein M3N95_15885, partial [Actinomycetota bacterium]|nr:hypothetical protein [Actinomycetota bacterium]